MWNWLLSLLRPRPRSPRAFFSYSRKHAEVVKDFFSFSTIFGGQHFLDEHSIPYGADFRGVIQRAIDDCDVFVLMWCACAAESEWVRMELCRAIERRKRIVPVFLGKHPLPELIKTRNAMPLREPICVQTAFGMNLDEDLFEDVYRRFASSTRVDVVRHIENGLLRLLESPH